MAPGAKSAAKSAPAAKVKGVKGKAKQDKPKSKSEEGEMGSWAAGRVLRLGGGAGAKVGRGVGR